MSTLKHSRALRRPRLSSPGPLCVSRLPTHAARYEAGATSLLDLASDAAWMAAHGSALLTETSAYAAARAAANLRLALLLVARDIIRDMCPCVGHVDRSATSASAPSLSLEAHTAALRRASAGVGTRPVPSADVIAARAAKLAARGSAYLLAQALAALEDSEARGECQ